MQQDNDAEQDRFLKAYPTIKLYKWFRECWKCKQHTPIVTYNFIWYACYHIGNIDELDLILMEKYPFIKKVYSKTMESECISNVCIHCGSIQGNFFVSKMLIDFECSNVDMDKLVDSEILNKLNVNLLPY